MKRTLFVVVWWGLCAVVLEAGLQLHYRLTVGQWLFDRAALPLWEADPISGFRLRPLQTLSHCTPEFRTEIHTNSAGFRVSSAREEFSRDPADGVPRVLLLGPSFAFGWGVNHEDTFLQRLRLHWGTDDGVAVPEVINAGVPALGPVQQLAWYRAEGRKWNPDLVIQFVYGSPEVSAEYSESLMVSDEGYLVPRNATWKRRFVNSSKCFGVVFYGWNVATRVAGAVRRDEAVAGGASGTEGGGRIDGGGRLLVERREPFDPSSGTVRRTEEFYDDFGAAMDETGARGLVVFLPLAYRIHPEDLERWRHRGVVHPEQGLRHDQALITHLRNRGVPLLDLTEDLEAAATGGDRLYYRLDIHWTPAGHDVAARSVVRYLQESAG